MQCNAMQYNTYKTYIYIYICIYILSYHVISYHVISSRIMPIISYHIISYHVNHIISYYILLYHIKYHIQIHSHITYNLAVPCFVSSQHHFPKRAYLRGHRASIGLQGAFHEIPALAGAVVEGTPCTSSWGFPWEKWSV